MGSVREPSVREPFLSLIISSKSIFNCQGPNIQVKESRESKKNIHVTVAHTGKQKDGCFSLTDRERDRVRKEKHVMAKTSHRKLHFVFEI